MDLKVQQALEVLKKHNVAALAEVLEIVAFPALEAAVKASATPIDDVVLLALEAPLKKAIADAVAKL